MIVASISSGELLSIYCALVMLASLAGGWLLLAVHLNHTRLQLAVSLVAGLMLGIALLHFLPDAEEQIHSMDRTMQWVLGGFSISIITTCRRAIPKTAAGMSTIISTSTTIRIRWRTSRPSNCRGSARRWG